MKPELREKIEDLITQNRIVLFIKGTVDFPECGFSEVIVNIFNKIGMPYETVNIMANDALRQGMKEYSAWPAFPQVYLDGKFIGGCKLVRQLFVDELLIPMIAKKPKKPVEVETAPVEIEIGSDGDGEKKEMDQ